MKSQLNLHAIAKKIPFVRGFAHQVSPYFTGSVLENRLGLQPYRMVGKHLSWQLRKKTCTSGSRTYQDVLESDGVIAIPDFLTQTQFLQIRAEFDRATSGLEFNPFREAKLGKIHVARFQIDDDCEDFPGIRQYLRENPLILTLASAVIRRPISSPPGVLASVYRSNDPAAPDNDVENVLHADLHTPTVKVFYYLNDIDENNGAFIYAKGSHKFTLNRLRHEYDISVRAASLVKNGDEPSPHLVAVRGAHKRPVISQVYKQKMMVKETSFCGRANTLVITNNMGFHRRGEFTCDKPRETILLNFRHLEHCF